MKQEHYPSLELCKKLTEAGFTIPSRNRGNDLPYPHSELAWFGTTKGGGNTILMDCGELEGYKRYVCPSVMEMLDIMPKEIEKDGYKYWLTIVLNLTIVYTALKEGTPNLHCHIEDTGKLPNALAEMILWLHDNKYISFN